MALRHQAVDPQEEPGLVGGGDACLEQGADWITAWLRPDTDPSVTGRRIGWLSVEMHDREAVHAAIAQSRPDANS